MKSLRPLLLPVAALALVAGALWFLRLPVRPVADAAIPAPATPAETRLGAEPSPAPAAAPALAEPPAPAPRMLGLADLPAGRFREELARVDAAAQAFALGQLRKHAVPANDFASLRVDHTGHLYYECSALPAAPAAGDVPAETAPGASPSAGPVPISSPPVLHSKPGATKVIYLDFNGHVITGTAWNTSAGVATFTAKPFDSDSSPTTFSTTEQAQITSIWHRVAEDFRGFDVDVTTEEPASFTATTGRVLITSNVDASGTNMPSSTASGVAYLDVFGDSDYVSSYSPALVYANVVYNRPDYIAEVASHEMGHNLGLSHDGTATAEYYTGHGGSVYDYTSWAPIMGAGYDRQVTQWSKGEYFGANNPEDDVAILTAHLGLAPDDAGDTNGTAALLTVAGTAVSGGGVLGASDDTDRLAFTLASTSALTLTVANWTDTYYGYGYARGGDADLRAEILDAAGNVVVAEVNPANDTALTIDTGLAAGTYYLRVRSTGTGTPLANPPTGYTNYGNRGEYVVTGTLATPVVPQFNSFSGPSPVDAGATATIYVYTSGTPTPALQWQRKAAGASVWQDLAEGGNYTGTRQSVLSISSTTLGMNGDQFRCVGTNIAGSVTSPTAILTVNPATPPTFSTLLPAVVNRNYGDSLSLNANVSGSNPLTFQWSKNGTPISGATSSSFYLSAVTTADAATYSVTATNAAGSASSSTTLSVNPAVAPAIAGLPSAVTLEYGQTISLNPVIAGTGPLTYQWKKDGVNLSGATGSSYYRYGVTTADSGVYTLVATNFLGSTTSTGVTVTVNPAVAPWITGMAPAVIVDYGQTISLYPSVSGSTPITYQWKKDGVAIPGSTSSSFYKSNVTTADSGSYTVVATNAAGSVESSATVVTVPAGTAPQVFGLPVGVTLPYGQALSLNPSITGTQPRTYQWKKDGVNLPGGTSSSYYISQVTTANAGAYTVTVTNAFGSVTSNTCAVAVSDAIAPTLFVPAAVVVETGNYLSISPTVAGSTPMTFAWRKDGNLIIGANSQSFSKGNVTVADSGVYTLTAANAAGTVTSPGITVTVNPPVAPLISGLPANRNLKSGDALSLYPSVTGTQPMTFQWFKDDVALSGATSQSFYRPGMMPADAGTYVLKATNEVGTTTSSSVVVTVSAPTVPTIGSLPASVEVAYNGTLSLSASVTGEPSPAMQWKRNGVALSGQTSAYLYKYNVTTADSGAYTLEATNVAGSATSSTVNVTVLDPVPVTVTVPPRSIGVAPGTTAVLAVTATGTQPISYQWYLGETALPGATNASLQVQNFSADLAGDYKVVATNAAGAVTSPVATVSLVTRAGAVAVATSGSSSAVLDASGALWVAGDNSNGQLGLGAVSQSYAFVRLATNVAAVTAASGSLLYLTTDGTLYATGVNTSGQLGDGTTTTRRVPVAVATNVAGAWAGSGVSVFLKRDGTLWGMGANANGALTTTPGANQVSPVQLAAGVRTASAGWGNSYWVDLNGALWGRGANDAGQLGGSAPNPSVDPVQMDTSVASVLASSSGVLWLKADGSVWARGSSYSGQLGLGSYTSLSAVTLVASDGRALAAGGSSSHVTKTDGTLWGAGENYNGQLLDGTSTRRSAFTASGLTGVRTSAVGDSHALAVKSDGTVWAAGYNGYGQLGENASFYSNGTPFQAFGGTLGSAPSVTGVTAPARAAGEPVRLYWSPTAGASGYEVWRSTTNESGTATKVAGDLAAAVFVDGTASPGVAYYYWVKALNPAGAGGFSSSVSATYTNAVAPGISAQPLDVAVAVGQSATFTVGVTGNPAPACRWQRRPAGSGTWQDLADSAAFTGTATTSLTVVTPGTGASGDQFRCVVTNPAGTATTTAATLTVTAGARKDFNGDGYSDVLWENTTSGERAFWLLNGTAQPSWLALGQLPSAWRMAAVADLSGDGKPDIVWENTSTGQHYLWIMNGTAYSSGASLATLPVEWRVAGAGDFNADSKADLVWENTATGDRVIWFMDGATNTGSAGLGSIPVEWHLAAVGDFNADTKPDLLWENTTTGDRSVWLMNGTAVSSVVGLGSLSTQWRMIAAADFNADNKTDILWFNGTTGELGCWIMNGTSYSDWLGLGLLPLDWNLAPVCAGDFNADGKTDILWQNLSTGDRGIWLMHGAAFPLWVRIGTVPTVWHLAGSADLTNDGQRDLVWENTSTGARVLWALNGTTQTGTLSLATLDPAWKMAAFADFNADGKTDILWQNTSTGDRVIWYMDGTSNTGSTGLGGIPVAWNIAAAADFNGDGKPDILWQNTTTGDIGIWLMNGSSYLGWAGLGTIDPVWRMAGAADYNNDGQTDILWENTSTGERGYWIMNGSTNTGWFQIGVVPPAWKSGN